MKLYNLIPLLDASDEELLNISEKGLLSLSLQEMKTIQQYFKSLNRNPTDCELETIAQTWSEHCKHKTLTAKVDLTYYDGRKKIKKFYNNILKETIFYTTKVINHKDCISVFEDNAGIVKFNSKYGVAVKVETHNHPSALEPYGGAATGIGGVIRDIIGCGLGAKPIANTDIFCFGRTDYNKQLPENVHHPKRIFIGVVSGVRDYGNRMGIPTVNGAIVFDNGYLFNPLVYCGCIGIIPVTKIKKKVFPSEVIVLVGGKTGRDGIHGATFSSAALHKELPTSVVQIGDPITEKMFLDVLLKARDLNLYTAITDCGAGGLSSACGELTKECGCKVYLEKVPLKYEGLLPWEIWLSESQERMVVIVERKNVKKFISLCNSEDVEATVIGEVTDTKKLEVYYENTKVCDIDMNFLHSGVPKMEFKLKYKPNSKTKNYSTKKIKNYSIEKLIHKVISHPNVCSKEYVIRQYDHEVQANTVLKPLVGEPENNIYSPQDAVVIKPLHNEKNGIVIGCGIKPLLSKINVIAMTETVIDEAIRNIISAGANFNKIFLLDNFCWGDMTDKNQLGSLFTTCEIAKNIAIYFGTPFISGKDSLNNYYKLKIGNKIKKISIPETLLITAVGITENVEETISTEFKFPGNEIYLIGELTSALSGSILYDCLNITDGKVPRINLKLAKKIYTCFNEIKKYICSAHDISDGGMITTIIEMTFGKQIGAKIEINKNLELISTLFCEPNSCIIVEVHKSKKQQFLNIVKKNQIPVLYLGFLTEKPEIKIISNTQTVFAENITSLYSLWNSGIKI